jgi:dTDP-4-dehydrorhamnose 3,5-epimerase
MIFLGTELSGAYIIAPEPHEDSRGFFARTFCQREFEAHGLCPTIAPVSIASYLRKGTVRGMHFQYPPAGEAKVARCSRGAMLDIIVDLRPESPTFLRHAAVELNDRNRLSLYVPERFAQGYQTLSDDTEVIYQISEFYTPGLGNGLRYDDPALGLVWPLPVTLVSERDDRWPFLQDVEPELKQRMTRTEDGLGRPVLGR